MEPKPKISFVEVVLITPFLLIGDAIAIIPVLNIIVSVVISPLLNFYLYMKGMKLTYGLISSAIKTIPGLSVLPAYTAGFIALAYLENHPKSAVAKVAQKGLNIKTPKGALAQTAIK